MQNLLILLIFVLLIALIILFSQQILLIANRKFIRTLYKAGGCDQLVKLIKNPALSDKKYTCILIPGLRNGVESYNWNLSTEQQRMKTGIPITDSLQDKISVLGYKTVTFDTPMHGQNENCNISSIDEYCNLIKESGNVIVVGHSIGARIAQYYSSKYNTPYLMIDPTPDYILDNLIYTKHIEQPNVKEYINAHKFLEVIRKDKDKLKKLKWHDAHIIYSLDSTDKNMKQYQEYIDNIECKSKIMIRNGTHWVHITNPDTVLDVIRSIKN